MFPAGTAVYFHFTGGIIFFSAGTGGNAFLPGEVIFTANILIVVSKQVEIFLAGTAGNFHFTGGILFLPPVPAAMLFYRRQLYLPQIFLYWCQNRSKSFPPVPPVIFILPAALYFFHRYRRQCFFNGGSYFYGKYSYSSVETGGNFSCRYRQ